MQGVQVWILVRELRSHMQNGAAKKSKQASKNKQKQIDIQGYQKKEI